MFKYLALCAAMLLVACAGNSDSDLGTGDSGAAAGAGGGGTAGAAAHAGTGAAAGQAGGGAGSGGQAGTAGSDGGLTCQNCEHSCCGDQCVNLDNDIKNCGTCGNSCGGTSPFCDQGDCKDNPPCDNGAEVCSGGVCCGKNCCATGQICCAVPGPVALPDGPLQCVTPINGTCPLGCKLCTCNAPDTPIATPQGNQDIATLRAGDWVLSMHAGELRPVRVLQAHSVVAANHFVMQIELETRVTLRISPQHPTADGRTFGQLRAGQMLDGVRIEAAELVPYRASRTYDILPDSDSGTYYAGGVLIASTLSGSPARLARVAPFTSNSWWQR